MIDVAPPPDDATLSITFAPTTRGLKSCLITIASNDPDTPNTTFTLTGTGTGSVVSVSAGPLVFGNQRINTTQQFNITSAQPPPNIVIASGANSVIDIDCAPTSVGTKTASVSVLSNAETVTSSSSTLTCTGVNPDITTSPASIAFANTDVGATSAATSVTLSNANGTFTSTLTVTSVTISGTNAGDFADAAPNSNSAYTILENGSVRFNVTFSPSDLGLRTATLDIFSDDQETAWVQIPLSGTGFRPEIDVTAPTNLPPTLDFGDVNVGVTSSAQTVTVRNSGNKSLTISGVTLIGGSAAEFSIASGSVPPPNVVVAPSSTVSWTVDCTPTSTGAKSASLRIASDDANENTDIALDCYGVDLSYLFADGFESGNTSAWSSTTP